MSHTQPGYRTARRIIIAIMGGTVILAGLIMLVTPGPGTPTIAIGLGILSLEFYWAKRWLARLRRKMREMNGSISHAIDGDQDQEKHKR